MAKIDSVREKVKELYGSKNPSRDEWADWLYHNHVLVAADNAINLAKTYKVDSDLSEAAALLHDCADAVMSRFEDDHEARSNEIARGILMDCGYSGMDEGLVVDDALRFHSCHNGQKPKSGVGKVLATADALAHLDTDYYSLSIPKVIERDGEEKAYDWALKKIDRDFNDKIFFEEVRIKVKPKYLKLKESFLNENTKI
jgi:HD superfamily phosphodiesterase